MKAIRSEAIVAGSKEVSREGGPLSISRELVKFICLTFAISWGIWLIYWLVCDHSDGNATQLATVVGSFGPAIAAVIVRVFVTREGLRDELLRPRPRRAWPYYLVAIFWPLPIMVAFVLLAPLLGIGSSGGGSQEIFGALLAAILLTPIFFGEEYGWRGFLQGRIAPGRPLLAALATGIVWGTWHFPAVAFGLVANEHGWASMALFPLYNVLFSVILGWLTIRSKTVWPAVLAHSSNNMVLPAFGAMFAFTGGNGDLLFTAQGLLLMALLGILCLTIALSGQMRATTRESEPDRATKCVE